MEKRHGLLVSMSVWRRPTNMPSGWPRAITLGTDKAYDPETSLTSCIRWGLRRTWRRARAAAGDRSPHYPTVPTNICLPTHSETKVEDAACHTARPNH